MSKPVKIYKQSFWRAYQTKVLLWGIVLLFILMLWAIFDLGFLKALPTGDIWADIAIFFFLLTQIILPIAFFTQYFYVVIEDNKLIICNLIYRFWKAEYYYSDIEKAQLGYTGGFTRPYIRIITARRKSWRYVIELVPVKEYQNLIKDLQEKGVKVETPGLDNFLK